MTEKVGDYQTFLSDYIVKATLEKQKAVSSAEKKLIDKYEAIIAGGIGLVATQRNKFLS
jgi:hypothetical protein